MTPDRAAELASIRDAINALARRADAIGEPMLAYLLDMAAVEARSRLAAHQ